MALIEDSLNNDKPYNEQENTKCLGCDRNFKNSSILKHIGKSVKCSSTYKLPTSKSELQRIKNLADIRSKEKNKKRVQKFK